MSRKSKTEEYYRFFTVTDPRTHEKGHTEYKVTARFVSKTKPENVKEVVVWKRYSELKKLHGELAYTHRNLFRRLEEFPPFPRAQVFGRFDEAVIEERRKAAEDMLLFSTNIPALYNSPQLKDFFRGGEVRRPLETAAISTCLPPPLIPLPERNAELLAEEETGRDAPIPAQELESNPRLTDLAQPEVAVEAFSVDRESSPTPETQAETQIQELTEKESDTDITTHESNGTDTATDATTHASLENEIPGSPVDQLEEFDSLFDSGLEEHLEKAPPPLSDTDLAIFDPCAKEDQPYGSPSHAQLLSVPLTGPNGTESGGDVNYVHQANEELNAAQEREREGDYSGAVKRYRMAVDIFMKGVQGDVDLKRREAVKRKIAEVLELAERLLSIQTPTHDHNT
ncbi:sorting nexin-15 isoform X1 [Rhinichthys klamathensis goyatoka]|uniref:sorting nexin-15 isoform X1 n=1 Tax=Rhinichthys klamathensis goyatoka TaxID=3034132 RepID=UPI0024B5965C|nr:sorting nexin-15 isoform X1 [Rhinichthys klamathensis goyatoka]